jgi:hypothetical protein
MDVFIRLHREQTVNCRGADFNRDGRPDYLLFNPSTRQSAIRYLSGVKWVGSAYGPTIASGYQLTGTADFNGDGARIMCSTRARAKQQSGICLELRVSEAPTVPLLRLTGTWSRLERQLARKAVAGKCERPRSTSRAGSYAGRIRREPS